MGFMRLTAIGATAAAGRGATMIQAAIIAKMKQEATRRQQGGVGQRGNQGTLARNKAALAAALAGIPVTRAPRANAPKATPASTATNKARLAALLDD